MISDSEEQLSRGSPYRFLKRSHFFKSYIKKMDKSTVYHPSPCLIEVNDRMSKCNIIPYINHFGSKTREAKMPKSCFLSKRVSKRKHNYIENRVRFGIVQIHFHEVTLGDSPFVREGPPLQLSERCSGVSYASVTQFERKKMQSRPRQKSELIISPKDRFQMLKAAKIPVRDIANVVGEIRRIQKENYDRMIQETYSMNTKMLCQPIYCGDGVYEEI